MENRDSMPLVTIYTCVYNGEKTLHRVFKSVENITEDPALRAEFWAYFQSKQRHRYDAVCATIEQKDLYTAF